MALKVKAKEREMKIGKNPGVYRYVMLPELYSTLDQDKVIKEAPRHLQPENLITTSLQEIKHQTLNTKEL